MNISKDYTIPVNFIIHHLASGKPPLTNLEICDLAEKHDDRNLFIVMVQTRFILLKQDPLTQKISPEVIPGDRFCQHFATKFQDEIESVHNRINRSFQIRMRKIRDYVVEEIYQTETIPPQKKTEKRQETRRVVKPYKPAKEIPQRHAIKIDGYHTALAVYEGKNKLELALDDIFVVAHAPGDFIPKKNSESRFQRRTQEEKTLFVNTQKPIIPYLGKSYKPDPFRREISEPAPAYRDRSFAEILRLDRRPIQFHEESLDTFESVYVVNELSYVQRLEMALTTLNRQFGLFYNDSHYADMRVELRGESVLISDIVFNKNHPHFQLTGLKKELQDRLEGDRIAKEVEKARLQKIIDQANESRLQARQEAAQHCLQLRRTQDAVLTEFSVNQQCAKTHRIIQHHNEKEAIQLFREVYLSQRRSLAGSMHKRVVNNDIKSFSVIETYACKNKSKTRKILEKYKSEFDKILYSPLFMEFEFEPNNGIRINVKATFVNDQEANAYSAWYIERCPKYRSDRDFIRMFTTEYAQRVPLVDNDKKNQWIREGAIFSHKQLVHFAKMNPNSEAANILSSSLAERLQLLEHHEKEIRNLTIQSQHYISPEAHSPEDLYATPSYLAKIGVDTIYDFKHKCETYSPPQQAEEDEVRHMELYHSNRNRRRTSNVESDLYDFYVEQVMSQ